MRSSFACEAPIDYVARWRQLVAARVAQGKRLDRLHDRTDHWAGDRAARFRRMTSQPGATDPLFEFLRPWITPASTVLDVGAGTGRHVLRFARQVSKVTAVEPSAAMRAELEAGIQEAGVTNVDVVAAAWPNADVEPADIVICSHVAYFVSDIESVLRRLDEVNRGRCAVVLRHVQREVAILDLFEKIWNEPRCPEPTFADLFGAACQLGIWANVVNFPFTTVGGFDGVDEAVRMVKGDLLNPEGAEAEKEIRDYLAERLVQRNGKWLFNTPPTCVGVLWWEARD